MTSNANRIVARIEMYQGDSEDGRPFGYVHGDDGGGFFFTWGDTLASTLSSVEEDEVDGDGGLDMADVVELLRERLPATRRGREMWSE